jgi:hypothetical protein
VSLGSLHRPLGELARRLDRYDLAAAHFARAVAVNERFGHRPEVVRSRLGLARTLCALGRFEQAELESAAAYTEAEARGLTPIAALALDLAPRSAKKR